MKTIFLIAAILFLLTSYSQDTAKLSQIDSLVSLINTSDFKIEKDTLKQDQPDLGLFMQTYLTMVTSRSEIKKFVNNVHMTRKENGVDKRMVSTNTFYFDHNKLIKVEEFAGETEGDKQFEALWYYADDKPIYYTLQSDKAQARAELLLTMGKAMVEKIKF
jgi:hypothetical protein